MKKLFFLAFAFVASALAFTSCDPNNPDNPQEVSSIKELVGTMWRVDTAYTADGNVESAYYQVFKITSETSYKLLDEEEPYTISVKDHQVVADNFFGQFILDVKEATTEYIHMETQIPAYDEAGNENGTTTLRVSLGRIPESNGKKVELTAENVIGTWKADYYLETGVYTSGESWMRVMSSWEYHGLDYYYLNADGSLVFENLMQKWMDGAEYKPAQGFWAIQDGKLALAVRYEGDSGEVQAYEYNDVEELTTNVMYLRHVYMGNTTFTYFHKVK